MNLAPGCIANLYIRAPWLWNNVSPAIPLLYAYVLFIGLSSFIHASVTNPGVSSLYPITAMANLCILIQSEDTTSQPSPVPPAHYERRSPDCWSAHNRMGDGQVHQVSGRRYGGADEILQELQHLASATRSSLPGLRQLCRNAGSSLRLAQQLRRSAQLPLLLHLCHLTSSTFYPLLHRLPGSDPCLAQ